MTLVCSRCATRNSRWEKHCRSCWLPLDAALPIEPASSERRTETASADDVRGSTGSAESADGTADPPAEPSDLMHQLSIEAEHVRALADAGIHTLEHVAQALPATLAHVLRAWTHIDAEALIARARHLLHAAHPDGAREQSTTEPAMPDPDPAPWWKA